MISEEGCVIPPVQTLFFDHVLFCIPVDGQVVGVIVDCQSFYVHALGVTVKVMVFEIFAQPAVGTS